MYFVVWLLNNFYNEIIFDVGIIISCFLNFKFINLEFDLIIIVNIDRLFIILFKGNVCVCLIKKVCL